MPAEQWLPPPLVLLSVCHSVCCIVRRRVRLDPAWGASPSHSSSVWVSNHSECWNPEHRQCGRVTVRSSPKLTSRKQERIEQSGQLAFLWRIQTACLLNKLRGSRLSSRSRSMHNSLCFIILSWVIALLAFPGKTSPAACCCLCSPSSDVSAVWCTLEWRTLESVLLFSSTCCLPWWNSETGGFTFAVYVGAFRFC